VACIFIASLCKALCEFFSSLWVTQRVNELASILRVRLFEKYLAAGKTFHDKNNSGHMMAVILSFVTEISHMLNQIRGVATQSFHCCVYLAILFYTSWKLAFLSLLLIPAMYLGSRVLNK